MKKTKYIYGFPGVGTQEKRVVYMGGETGSEGASKDVGDKNPDAGKDSKKVLPGDKSAADDFLRNMQAINKPAAEAQRTPTKPADAQMPTPAGKKPETATAQPERHEKGTINGVKVSWEGINPPMSVVNQIVDGVNGAPGAKPIPVGDSTLNIDFKRTDGTASSISYEVTVTKDPRTGAKSVLMRGTNMATTSVEMPK